MDAESLFVFLGALVDAESFDKADVPPVDISLTCCAWVQTAGRRA